MTTLTKEPKSLSQSEFLVFTAVCDLQGGTAAEVQDRLARQYDSDLSVTAVDVILTRVVQKGWLRALPSGNASPEPLFAPAVPYNDAVVLHFRRFLQQHGMNRPEVIAVLKAALETQG
jgi:predicted transcriptional regulator